MNSQINHKTTGYLLLLLILLVFHLLKTTHTPSRPSWSAEGGQLFIYVGGDVELPAVYAFNGVPNLKKLINRAGGLSSHRVLPERLENASFSSGMKVVVHLEGEEPQLRSDKAPGIHVKASEMSAFYKTTLGIPIYLNSESEMGLTAIPGIGLGLAKVIVEERTKRGGFKSLEELLSVKGIGEKLYRKITPYLTVQERKT